MGATSKLAYAYTVKGKQEKPVVSASDKCQPTKGSSEGRDSEAQGEPAAENAMVYESADNAVDTEGVLRQGNPAAAGLNESCEKKDQAIAVSKRPREVTDVDGTLEQDDGGSNEGPPSKASVFRRSSVEASSGPTTVDGADNSKPSEEEFPPLSQGTDVKAEPNKNTEDATEDAEADKSACMHVSEAPSSGVAAKRAHEDTNETTANTDGEGQPPTKEAIVRRPTMRPRPNANSREAQPSTPSSCPEGERNKQQVAVTSKDQHEPAKGVDSASTGRDAPPDVQPPVSVTESVEEYMDVSRDGASSMAGKRAHERTVDSEQQRGEI
ncbi:hypothetical protein HPB49_013783 [Dermacentor silvarum]|uniref:Uncharacterized protein n=1 Tax=Dermacentor silvarum TaxID=543639 RepID=A0ACB8D5Y6_DERSI|nr:hypothetical protein HPB49_013783 [Dermacentor silvarum]